MYRDNDTVCPSTTLQLFVFMITQLLRGWTRAGTLCSLELAKKFQLIVKSTAMLGKCSIIGDVFRRKLNRKSRKSSSIGAVSCRRCSLHDMLLQQNLLRTAQLVAISRPITRKRSLAAKMTKVMMSIQTVTSSEAIDDKFRYRLSRSFFPVCRSSANRHSIEQNMHGKCSIFCTVDGF